MGVSTAARGDSHVVMITAASAADTAAATSAWFDIRPYKGDILVTHQVGAVTGSITSKLRTATADDGTGAADITGATFTAVSAANKVQTISIPKGAGPFIQYVGTVVTGPVLLSVVMSAKPGVA